MTCHIAQLSSAAAISSGTRRQRWREKRPKLSLAARGATTVRATGKWCAATRSVAALCSSRGLATLRDRNVIALDRPGIKLTRAANLLVGILDHLIPLRDPADGAGDREQHGEHRGREAHRL